MEMHREGGGGDRGHLHLYIEVPSQISVTGLLAIPLRAWGPQRQNPKGWRMVAQVPDAVLFQI